MPFKTFTDGSVLTASDVNTHLMQQSIIRCTSSTRPTPPTPGMMIYEFDTDLYQRYNSNTSLWEFVAVGDPIKLRGFVSTTPTGSSGGEQAIYRADNITTKANWLYKIILTGIGVDSTGVVDFLLRWRFTINGVVPTTADAILTQYRDRVPASGFGPIFSWTSIFTAGAVDAQFQPLLTLTRTSGSTLTQVVPTSGGMHFMLIALGPTKTATGITF